MYVDARNTEVFWKIAQKLRQQLLVDAEFGACGKRRIHTKADGKTFSPFFRKSGYAGKLPFAVGDQITAAEGEFEVAVGLAGRGIIDVPGGKARPQGGRNFSGARGICPEALRPNTFQHMGVGVALDRVEELHLREVFLQAGSPGKDLVFIVEIKAFILRRKGAENVDIPHSAPQSNRPRTVLQRRRSAGAILRVTSSSPVPP